MKDTSATQRVGRYQLLEPIGIGCCGAVSRAKVFGVAGFERQFAVKKFHAELTATAAMAQALSSAARAYGSLEHPRIARMSEFGVAQGATFTAVELVAGLDALRLLAEAKLAGVTLAAGGALTLISQAARAVGYAHGRGLTHLGLAPTNVIVTADGDVKITDFGILAATLPARPAEVPRLANRIGYLAPEQVAGEATSAATDVFALGVIAYELVTGQRAFRGATPAQVAQAIMNNPPPEPPLPRPIVRVLQRCLARSPFERFPDARALADALDAALRVAPVPGTRKDIGAQVKETIDRLAAINEGGLSGMVALNVGTGPVRRIDPPDVRSLGRDASYDPGLPMNSLDLATSEFLRPDGEQSAEDALPSTTLTDMLRTPLATMPGLAPPPIPVPQGVVTSSKFGGNVAPPSTLLGIPSTQKQPVSPPKGVVPNIKPMVPATVPAIPGPALGRASTREVNKLPRRQSAPLFVPDAGDFDKPAPPGVAGELAAGAGLELELEADFPTEIGMAVAAPRRKPATTAEFSSQANEKLIVGSTRPTAEVEPLVAAVVAQELGRVSRLADALPPAPEPPRSPLDESVAFSPGQPTREHDVENEPEPAQDEPAPVRMMSGLASPSAPLPTTTPGIAPALRPSQPRVPSLSPPVSTPTPASPPAPPSRSLVDDDDEPRRSKVPWIIGIVVGLGVMGFVGWQVVDVMSDDDMPAITKRPIKPNPTTNPAAADAGVEPDATQIAAITSDAATITPPDATTTAAVLVDAASGGPSDAPAVATAPVDAAPAATADAQVVVSNPGSKDSLVIDSKPRGARVFIGGADMGVTPATVPGTADSHSVALILAGHDLYLAQIEGHGSFTIPLKEITPLAGPAGIKVLKCKADRYYIFIDGKPTGQTCPTERIETDLGSHVVEWYDAITETRRKAEIVVKDTRLSVRVKIE